MLWELNQPGRMGVVEVEGRSRRVLRAGQPGLSGEWWVEVHVPQLPANNG